jgi:hypothetical protein
VILWLLIQHNQETAQTSPDPFLFVGRVWRWDYCCECLNQQKSVSVVRLLPDMCFECFKGHSCCRQEIECLPVVSSKSTDSYNSPSTILDSVLSTVVGNIHLTAVLGLNRKLLSYRTCRLALSQRLYTIPSWSSFGRKTSSFSLNPCSWRAPILEKQNGCIHFRFFRSCCPVLFGRGSVWPRE